jgi:hypothetical protein
MKNTDEIADYKEAAEILHTEFAALNWHETKVHGGHLTQDESGWKHRAYSIEFAPPSNARAFFDWKSGTGIERKPILSEVLARCCADYLSAAPVSFSDFAAEFGYDEDSRKAFRIYEECQQIGPRLQKLGLTRQQIERFAALANML